MNIKKSFQEYLRQVKPVKTLIHWYDLYEGHGIVLNKNFQDGLFGMAIEKAGSIAELGRQTSIERKVVSNIINKKYNPKIKTLKKVALFCNYPMEDINTKVEVIAGLNPKLPFNLNNKEGAEIRAAFISDGHIDKSPIKQCQYCALEKELHHRLIDLCKDTFGEFRSDTYFNSGAHVTKFSSVIGNALELGGVPKGNKTKLNFYLPNDILLGDKAIQSAYLRRVFDDEGDVCFNKYGKRAVRMTRSGFITNLTIDIPSEKWMRIKLSSNFKHNLIIGEQLLLLKLGIDAKLYQDGLYKNKEGEISAKWKIQIGQQDQLRKFAELINFSLNSKRNKLNQLLTSYQFRKLPNGKGKEEALNFINKVYKKKGFFTFGDLGRELVRTGRSHDLAGRYIQYFINKKIIKRIKQGTYVSNKT